MNAEVLRTRDGTPWTPSYVAAIDRKLCIGCGRCFKVCGQGVLKMMGVDEDGSLIDADDDEAERMVMTLDPKRASASAAGPAPGYVQECSPAFRA